MILRDYQEAARVAAVRYMRTNTEPGLIDAATGAGKSHIIAAIAHDIHQLSGKKILCLAPSKELVEQNREKYLKTGNPASIFSASSGKKETRHPVVFGTPGTVKNSLHRFKDGYALVIIDEAHGVTPTMHAIVDAMREENPKLRVLGLTATAYRTKEGYIYARDTDGVLLGDHLAKDPYYHQLIYQIGAHELIQRGYLTPPVIGEVGGEHYVPADNITDDRPYVGQGRLTAAIIAEIIQHARNRKGVMVFAASVRHAEECMQSLPPSLSAMVTGKTPKAERERIIARFKSQQTKYIVSVGTLTTGFDASHVDCIALLRATESPGLMQQIIGRGLRLDENKKDCLVLDYAENMLRHFPDGDIFAPDISASKSAGTRGSMGVICPVCGDMMIFSARENPDGYPVDKHGYFLDLDGNRISTDSGDLPGHYGRACLAGCGYYWSHKECPECQGKNDIAARFCRECKAELVNPNEKLTMDFSRFKADPYQVQTDAVISLRKSPSITATGKPMMQLDVVTNYRTFRAWVFKLNILPKGKPETITYYKKGKFYNIVGFNADEDSKDNFAIR